MNIFEGSNILVSSSNYSYMGQILLEEGEVFDVVFPTEAQFAIGDPITATLYHRNGILTFQSAVISTIEEGRILLVKPSRDTTLLNRRRHERFDVELPAVVKTASGELTATVLDLSVGGLRFTSDKYVEEGSELEVIIENQRTIGGKGIVRRVQLRDGVFVVGLEFVHKEKLQANIEQYLKRYHESKSEATLN